jgi:type IV fimbrial biogenesis protein FimT
MEMCGIKKRSSGFTLVELMITLVIAAVLLGAVAPGMGALMERNRLQTGAHNLFGSLMLARSEALKRNQNVVMCKSADATACTTSGEWNQGWLIYADADSDGAPDPNEILQVSEALGQGDTLFVSGSDFSNVVSYRTDGSASGIGTFVLCNSAGDLNFAREVDVSITGRPKLNKSTTDCTP